MSNCFFFPMKITLTVLVRIYTYQNIQKANKQTEYNQRRVRYLCTLLRCAF